MKRLLAITCAICILLLCACSQTHREEYEYDKNGNLIRQNFFNDKGKLTAYHTYTYNEDNLRLSRNCYYANGNLFANFTYTYDGELLLNETAFMNHKSNTYTCSYNFTYDEYGRLIKEEFYVDDDILDSYTLYSYNAQDFLVLKELYHSDGQLDYREEYTPDNSGRLIKLIRSIVQKDSSVAIYIDECEYDDNGKLSKVKCTNENGKLIHNTVYEFNDNGHNTREYDSLNRLSNICQYDLDDHLIRKDLYGEDGEYFGYYTYELDELGLETDVWHPAEEE